MGSCCSSTLRVVYGITLGVNMLWTTALMCLLNLVPMSTLTRQGLCLSLVQLAWRLSVWFSPWISLRGSDDYSEQWNLILSLMAEADEESKREGTPTHPLFIMANHTSFFDTVIGVVKMPLQVLWRCRTYMDHSLFKLPVLSTVCKSVGHFPVYFTSTEDGKFKTDADKMEQVEKKVDTHLANGGWLCFFPEGQMNKSPDTILPFRYGGMKRALASDARLVNLVFRGNTEVWPKRFKLGGFPGTIHYSMRPIAPQGARAFVEMARAEGVPEEKDLQDHELLARRCHELMQAQYDALAVSNNKSCKAD